MWFACNHHVPHTERNRPASPISQSRRKTDDESLHSQHCSNRFRQSAVGESFLPNSLRYFIPILLSLFHRRGRQVVNADRLEPVISGAQHPKSRQVLQRPGYIVDQDVLLPEQDCRSQNTVGSAEPFEGRFQFGFATKIRQVRINVGIGNSQGNDAFAAKSPLSCPGSVPGSGRARPPAPGPGCWWSASRYWDRTGNRTPWLVPK